MNLHHRKQENGTSLKTGFSYITLRYITDVKWGVNGREGKWKGDIREPFLTDHTRNNILISLVI